MAEDVILYDINRCPPSRQRGSSAAIKRMKAEIVHLATDDIVGNPDFSKMRTLGIVRPAPQISKEAQKILDEVYAATKTKL